MRRPQAQLPGFEFKGRLSFGGASYKSHPKTARPIVTKKAMHLVLHAAKAQGRLSFLFHAKAVETLVKAQAARQGVRLYDLANAGNHLHLVIRVPSPRAYKRFVRSISGLLVRKVCGVQRGKALSAASKASSNGFWTARPFSRVVSWGRDYTGLMNYLDINRGESQGFERMEMRFILRKIAEIEREERLQATGFS
jgi:hypothetical protein